MYSTIECSCRNESSISGINLNLSTHEITVYIRYNYAMTQWNCGILLSTQSIFKELIPSCGICPGDSVCRLTQPLRSRKPLFTKPRRLAFSIEGVGSDEKSPAIRGQSLLSHTFNKIYMYANSYVDHDKLIWKKKQQNCSAFNVCSRRYQLPIATVSLQAMAVP